MSNDELSGLSVDAKAVLYVNGSSAESGTLRTMIPIAMQALRKGAQVDIQLADWRCLDADDIRELLTRWVGGNVHFIVQLERREVYHQQTGTTFRIGEGDSLMLLSDPRMVSLSDLPLIKAGAIEEISRMRRLDPAVSGFWKRT